jgi:hypothetical protein
MGNANIATLQGANVNRFGGVTPVPMDFTYDEQRVALMLASMGHVGFSDDFLGDTLNPTWVPDLSTSSTAALNQQANGAVRLTTHTDDNANATLALGLHWLVSNGPMAFWARFTNITAITARAVEVGVSDALSETNGQAFTSHDATPVAVADDAALFGFNADDTMTTMAAVSVNGGGTPQQTQSVLTPVAATWNMVGIVIDAAGNAYFYTSTPGAVPTLVATHALAVATTALLTPWISITNLTAATARTMDVDFVTIAGERS